MSCATQSSSTSWLRAVLAAPLHGDLGLSRRELEHELRRPFWDATRDS
jgi:hypothetical protein